MPLNIMSPRTRSGLFSAVTSIKQQVSYLHAVQHSLNQLRLSAFEDHVVMSAHTDGAKRDHVTQHVRAGGNSRAAQN